MEVLHYTLVREENISNMKGERNWSCLAGKYFYYYEIGRLMECLGVAEDHSRCQEL